MIHDFGDKHDYAREVIEKELQMKPEEFDKQFLAWLEPQTEEDRRTLRRMAQARARHLADLAKDKKWDEAIKEGEAIRDMYPEYVEMGNVYRIPVAKPSSPRATKPKPWRSWSGIPKSADAIRKLSSSFPSCMIEQGRKKDAAAVLERLNLIYLEDETRTAAWARSSLDLGNAKWRGARVSGGAGPEAV